MDNSEANFLHTGIQFSPFKDEAKSKMHYDQYGRIFNKKNIPYCSKCENYVNDNELDPCIKKFADKLQKVIVKSQRTNEILLYYYRYKTGKRGPIGLRYSPVYMLALRVREDGLVGLEAYNNLPDEDLIMTIDTRTQVNFPAVLGNKVIKGSNTQKADWGLSDLFKREVK